MISFSCRSYAQVCKREVPDSWHPDSGSEDHQHRPASALLRHNGKRHRSQSGGGNGEDSDLLQDYKAMLKRDRSVSLEEIKREKPGYLMVEERARSGSLEDRMCSSSSDMEDRNTPIALTTKSSSTTNNAGLIEAARAAGLDIPVHGNNRNGGGAAGDPMSSISALLAAAQATGGLPSATSTTSASTTSTTTSGAGVVVPHLPPAHSQVSATNTGSFVSGSSASSRGSAGSGSKSLSSAAAAAANQGLDLSNPAAAMANVNVSLL